MSQQEFYELWFSDDDPDPLYTYPHELQGVNEYFVFDGARIQDWPAKVTLTAKGKNLSIILDVHSTTGSSCLNEFSGPLSSVKLQVLSFFLSISSMQAGSGYRATLC